MSAVDCTLNTLIKNQGCYTCFSEMECLAAVDYLLSRRLASLSASAVLTPAQLRSQTACLACSRPELVADAMDVWVARAGAINGGAAISTMTPAQLKAAFNPFRNMTMNELRSIEIYLRCSLNAYP